MTIGIIGAGAWGTALAESQIRAGNHVVLWSRNQVLVHDINQNHENTIYLPGVPLSPKIKATDNLGDVIDSDIILLTIPAQQMRSVYTQIAGKITGKLVLCAKGIEQNTLLLQSEVINAVHPYSELAVLSGPNFAREIVHNLPAATTIASAQPGLAEFLSHSMSGNHFRIYPEHDVIGVQIGGAVKNVLAIACGIVMGCRLGENARAALIARGLAEMQRLCTAKGGDLRTLMGLSGVGDLVLTCSSTASRNFSLGVEFAKKDNFAPIAERNTGLAEGEMSAKAVTELAEKLGVEMPICSAVSNILFKQVDLFSTIERLLSRKVGVY